MPGVYDRSWKMQQINFQKKIVNVNAENKGLISKTKFPLNTKETRSKTLSLFFKGNTVFDDLPHKHIQMNAQNFS